MRIPSKLRRPLEIAVSLLPVSLYCLDIACGNGTRPNDNQGGDANDEVATGIYDAPCHDDSTLTWALELGLVVERWETSVSVDRAAGDLTVTHTGFADEACAEAEVRLVMTAHYDLSYVSGEQSFDVQLFPFDTRLTPLTSDAATSLTETGVCGATFAKAKATPIVDDNCAVDYDFASGHYLYGVVNKVSETTFRLGAHFVREGETILRDLAQPVYTARTATP